MALSVDADCAIEETQSPHGCGVSLRTVSAQGTGGAHMRGMHEHTYRNTISHTTQKKHNVPSHFVAGARGDLDR